MPTYQRARARAAGGERRGGRGRVRSPDKPRPIYIITHWWAPITGRRHALQHAACVHPHVYYMMRAYSPQPPHRCKKRLLQHHEELLSGSTSAARLFLIPASGMLEIMELMSLADLKCFMECQVESLLTCRVYVCFFLLQVLRWLFCARIKTWRDYHLFMEL